MNEHISRAVCVALAARGIPQKECCEVLGVHRATMSNYVNNRLDWMSNPGERLLAKISYYLGVPVDDFFPPLTADKSMRLVAGMKQGLDAAKERWKEQALIRAATMEASMTTPDRDLPSPPRTFDNDGDK